MATHSLSRYPRTSLRTASLVTGFVAGAAAVLLFHQGALAVLHALGISPRGAFSMQAVPPWGIPQVWSLAFWGGVWGVVLAAVVARLDGAALVLAATLFGAVAPTLVAWFVVAPLKGQPLAAGGKPSAIVTALIINALWGLGTGLMLALFHHWARSSGRRI